ncbi:tripartite tricarboxylate transporter TctB family protein [Paracoccus ravus]|uniref:tripartite tricarboxylate transporter TctB family protein n=1 Tax=Paracoccus ravus TaxID=2447760 RepID=UPI00106E282B|nr:tripartite tricarboxylate transporter TctB family protein [Paracoccus ravus]
MHPSRNRRPGELVFNLILVGASLFLLYSAYGISGFEALSSPGAVPMLTTAVMVLAAGRILWEVLRKPVATDQSFIRDILPMPIVVTIAMVALYALALSRLGFIPTSVLFLIVMVRYLSRRGWGFCIGVAVGTVALIYLVFRLIFSVLMPQGIVPEGEILAWFSRLF